MFIFYNEHVLLFRYNAFNVCVCKGPEDARLTLKSGHTWG